MTTPDVGGRPAPHATTTPAGRPRRRRRGFTWAGRLALLTFALFVGAGAIGGGVAIATFLSLDDGTLPPVSDLEKISFPEQSVVYARDKTTELARFGDFHRDVVAWKDIPPVLVDATTAVEDRTFWENPGFDPIAIAAAALDTFRGNGRGASTITQQLVRQRLLEPELVQDPGRTAERKLKEIIQSIKLTQAFPGTEGEAAGDDGVPEPELLRQRLVRRGRRGADLFRQEPQGPDARAGGDHRGIRRHRRRTTWSGTPTISAPSSRPTARRVPKTARPSSSCLRTRRSSSAGTWCST